MAGARWAKWLLGFVATAGVGAGIATVGYALITPSPPPPGFEFWTEHGDKIFVLGMVMLAVGLLGMAISTLGGVGSWMKGRRRAGRRPRRIPLKFLAETQVSTPAMRRWRSFEKGTKAPFSVPTAIACTEAGMARYRRPQDWIMHRFRRRRYQEEVARVRCEPRLNYLPFVQAASGVISGLNDPKLTATAEDWRWESEEGSLQKAQDRLSLLPEEVQERYSPLLSRIEESLRARTEPTSEEFRTARSRLEEEINRDRDQWDP